MDGNFSSATRDQLRVNRLHIKTASSDRLAAQLSAARLFNTLSLQPSGLPSAAILCIRSLRDPRPGSLHLRRDDVRALRAWEEAVNHAIDQLAHQAVRPIEGAVPANAEAVLFADRSELLACLAADWCAGVVRAQWWWQNLLRHGDTNRAMIDAWLETPEYIPLALHRLAARRQAISFVQQLSGDHTRSMLKALVQTFDLYELSVVLDDVSDRQPEGLEVIEQHAGNTTSTMPIQVVPIAPWQPWIQTHSVEHLPPDRQVLLGVGLMLHEAPTSVRSASFARQVREWQIEIHIVQPGQPTAEEFMPTTRQVSPPPEAACSVARQPMERSPAANAASPDEVLESAPLSTPDRRPAPAENLPPSHRHRAADALTTETPVKSSGIVGGTETPVELADTVDRTKTPVELADTVERTEIEIETAFGGVCYFINLGLFLNLYGDFTTPLRPGIDLPIWDFMALVAQDLIGDEVTHDPIWPLLVQLADWDEDEPPGAHFDPTHNVIARSAVSDEAISQSRSEDCFADALAMTTLGAWLADLMLIVRPRLQLALGVSAEELPRYFKQRARLVVSAMHFDAYFALADLPIEIRLSGLDRDPGWVPAAGKFVAFHFKV